jgi:hypothetical protein
MLYTECRALTGFMAASKDQLADVPIFCVVVQISAGIICLSGKR